MSPKIEPITQPNVGCDELSDFDDLLQWVQKIIAVRIQSFMDAQYANCHQHATLDEGTTETMYRAKWSRMNYYPLLE